MRFPKRVNRLFGERRMYVRQSFAMVFSSLLTRVSPLTFEKKVKNPVFIIGSPRSGTTLLMDSLASHKEIATYPNEANDLWHPQTYPWRKSVHKSLFPPVEVNPIEFTKYSIQNRSKREETRLKSTFGSFQYLMKREHFLMKSALITFMIPYILDVFPTSKFIHIIRDGRGVVLSWAIKVNKIIRDNIEDYENQNFGITYKELLLNCSNSWKLHAREVDTQNSKHNLKGRGLLLEFKYEDFCQNPDLYLVKIANFINVSPDYFMDRSYDHIKNMNYKYKQQLSAEEIQEITEIMEPGLRRWNYI